MQETLIDFKKIVDAINKAAKSAHVGIEAFTAVAESRIFGLSVKIKVYTRYTRFGIFMVFEDFVSLKAMIRKIRKYCKRFRMGDVVIKFINKIMRNAIFHGMFDYYMKVGVA